MTEHGASVSDRDAISWVEEGPSKAPSGLLTVVLNQTRATTQRPAFFALAGGAPRVEPWGRPFRSVRGAWLVAALLLTSAILGLGLVAASIGSRPRVVAAPTASLSPTASLPPATQRTAPPRPSPLPTPIPGVSLLDGSVVVTVPATASTSGEPDRAAITSPLAQIILERWHVGDDHAIVALRGLVVRGDSLDSLASSIDAVLASTPDVGAFRRSTDTIDRDPAVGWLAIDGAAQRISANPFRLEIAVHGDVAYLLVARQIGDPLTAAEIEVAGLVSSINFTAPYPVIGPGRIEFMADANVAVIHRSDDRVELRSDGPCPFCSWVVVQRAALSDGIELTPLPEVSKPIVLSGRTLDQLAASLEKADPKHFGRANRVRLERDGRNGYEWTYAYALGALNDVLGPGYETVQLIVDGSDVYVIEGFPAYLSDIRFVR